jgi:hypothetical protein
VRPGPGQRLTGRRPAALPQRLSWGAATRQRPPQRLAVDAVTSLVARPVAVLSQPGYVSCLRPSCLRAAVQTSPVTFEFSGPKPMYAQLANELQRRIAAGVYPVGQRIPSETEIREESGSAATRAGWPSRFFVSGGWSPPRRVVALTSSAPGEPRIRGARPGGEAGR